MLLGPPGQTSAQAPGGESHYVVEPGDSLTAIAAKTGVSIDDLIALNELVDPDVIHTGQTLRLGLSGIAPARSYRVEAGDTLYSIAARTGTTVDQLLVLNELTDPNLLLVDQILALPASVTATAATSPFVTYAPWTSTPSPPRVNPRPSATPRLTAPRSPTSTISPPATVTGTSLPAQATPPAPTRSPLPSPGDLVPPGRSQTIDWKGSPNFWPGRPTGEPIALVIHTAGGTLEGMDRWFALADSQSSAHYGIGLDGRVHQYVRLADRAWANGYTEEGNLWPGPADVNPNDLTVSIEMEDWMAGPLPPDAQYQAAVAVGRVVVARYPGIRYLVTHRAIAPESRANDPGPRWVATGRFAALARALGLTPVP